MLLQTLSLHCSFDILNKGRLKDQNAKLCGESITAFLSRANFSLESLLRK